MKEEVLSQEIQIQKQNIEDIKQNLRKENDKKKEIEEEKLRRGLRFSGRRQELLEQWKEEEEGELNKAYNKLQLLQREKQEIEQKTISHI